MNISFVLNGVKVIEIEIPNDHIGIYDNLELDNEVKVFGIEYVVDKQELSFNKCEYGLVNKELYWKNKKINYVCDVCDKEFYKLTFFQKLLNLFKN